MIVVGRVFVALLLTVFGRLADEFDAGVRVECGNALLREVEVIGPVVEALFGFGIRSECPPLFRGGVALQLLGLEQESISITGAIVLFLIAIRMIFPGE